MEIMTKVLKPKNAKYCSYNRYVSSKNKWELIFYDKNMNKLCKRVTNSKPSKTIRLISPMEYYIKMKQKGKFKKVK